ncbi:MAG: hypothetical protein V3T20_09420 [Gemmatimonadota bacterium]
MKHALALALVATLVAGPALAVENPNISIWLDADPPNAVTMVEPGEGETFTVSVILDCFSETGGTRGIAFLFDRTFSGFKLSQTNLLGGLFFGDVEIDGFTIAAGEACVYPTGGIVVAAEIQYLYNGDPGTITILPHAGTGRNALDCDFEEDDQYCIAGGFGVHMAAPGNDEGCGCDAPIEAATWGAIKSLYR